MVPVHLVWSGRPECGIKCQVCDPIFFGYARLNVTAAFAFGFRARPPAGRLPGQSIELSIQTASGKLFGRFDILTAFPPLAVLRCLRYGLRTRLSLGSIRAFANFAVYTFFLPAGDCSSSSASSPTSPPPHSL